MKTNNIKSLLLGAITLAALTSCVKDDDYVTPALNPLEFGEDFEGGTDGSLLALPGWTNFAQAGTKKWMIGEYQGDKYAEFTSYQSGEASNIAWLVSPGIDMDKQDGEKLIFLANQSYVSNASNSLEVFVSTDYDGTNVLGATWIQLDNAVLPTVSSPYFEYIKSGEIDLSGYTGTLHVAFKVIGSGTNTALDGGYQIDDVRIFN